MAPGWAVGRRSQGPTPRPRPVPPPDGPAPPRRGAEGGRGRAPRVSLSLRHWPRSWRRRSGRYPGPGLGWPGVPGTRSRESTFRPPPLGRSWGRREGRGLRPECGPPSFSWDARRPDYAGVGGLAPPCAAARALPHPTTGTAWRGLWPPVSAPVSLPFPARLPGICPAGREARRQLGSPRGSPSAGAQTRRRVGPMWTWAGVWVWARIRLEVGIPPGRAGGMAGIGAWCDGVGPATALRGLDASLDGSWSVPGAGCRGG